MRCNPLLFLASKTTQSFNPQTCRSLCTLTSFQSSLVQNSWISSKAIVHPTANIHPNVVIHDYVKIGENCVVESGSVIGSAVQIEKDTVIGSHVTLKNCKIGERNVLHPGVRIGQDGFGFVLSNKGTHTKKPQELCVILQDDVEIGANTTIDRGSWRDTVIGKGCKLDNLIQIGHNVQIGKGCVIAAQTGIAGSVSIGDCVFIGGQVGIIQHLSIGSNSRIAAKSGVMSDIPPNSTYGGTPAMPIREYHRQTLYLRDKANGNSSSPSN